MRQPYAALAALLATLALSACNSSDGVLASTAGAQATTQPLSSTTTTGITAQPATGAEAVAQNRIPLNKVRLQIAPIVGAPVQAVAPLTERLRARLNERGIKFVGGTDKTTTHTLKGYFSAISEGGTTTVIYVWDVYDPAGNRLHRISGQQKVPSNAKAEGWGSVTAPTMQAIADATVEQFSVWLTGKIG